jgi:uncharacterized RDD family membrane protein YckC
MTDQNQNKGKMTQELNEREEGKEEKILQEIKVPGIIEAIAIIFTVVVFLLGGIAYRAYAWGMVWICLILIFYILYRYFKADIKVSKCFFSILIVLLIVTAVFFPTVPIIRTLVYVATPSPTAFPTCADITCPTVEVTPCPTYEITPCPTCEVVENPVEPTLTQPVPSLIPTVPWNFDDGCISYDWRYIPDTWEYKVGDDEACGGFDYSYFGFEAKELRGLNVLSIFYPSADGIYDFGIFRNFSEDLSYLKIEFTVENIVHSLENATYFNIGFGKTPDLRNFEGSYFRIYNITTDEYISIKILDNLHPDYENNEKWLGYINKGSTVTIECDEVFDRRIKCDYMLDGLLKFENLDVYLPKDWDSLYIGYEIPKGGTIEIYIDEIVVKQ